ncbi:MAG: NUDIX hydrolase [Opitutales bacterium]|nr:NUDIX hydrolase [Opitutales bacterium]
MTTHSYRIATLIFIENSKKEQLLIRRSFSPNQGLLSPIGGKLEAEKGETPVECAIREVDEEIGRSISTEDLHLFGYLAEKSPFCGKHWMVYLFKLLSPIDDLPAPIEEGAFEFHKIDCIEKLEIPQTDAQILWKVFKMNSDGFTGIRVDRKNDGDFDWTIETQS